MRAAVRAAVLVDEASARVLLLSHRAPLGPTAPGPLLRCRGRRGHGNKRCLRRVLAVAAVVLVSSSRLGSGKVYFDIELRRIKLSRGKTHWSAGTTTTVEADCSRRLGAQSGCKLLLSAVWVCSRACVASKHPLGGSRSAGVGVQERACVASKHPLGGSRSGRGGCAGESVRGVLGRPSARLHALRLHRTRRSGRYPSWHTFPTPARNSRHLLRPLGDLRLLGTLRLCSGQGAEIELRHAELG